jgi:hypothetical protein
MRRSLTHVLLVCSAIAISMAIVSPTPALSDPPPTWNQQDTYGELKDNEAVIGSSVRNGAQTPSSRPATAGGLPRDPEGNEYSCWYERIDDPPTPPGLAYTGADKLVAPEGLHWVQRKCRYRDPALADQPVVGEQYGTPSLREDTAPGAPTAESVMEIARNTLRGSVPNVRRWPSEVFLANVPARLRVENYESVGPINAAAGGTGAWAEAVPVGVTYRFHDGSTLTCGGAAAPGAAYPDVPDGHPTSCQTKFHASTAGATVSGTAEIVYDVFWWSTIDTARRPLGRIPSPNPLTFTYRIRAIEAVGRG